MSKENTNGTLSSVCELIVDCEHKTAPTEAEGYPSIRTPNIGRGRLLLDGVNRVSEETYQLWTRRATPHPNDLILAREAPVGNVAIIPDNLKVCLGQRTVLIRPDKTRVDANYLVNLLLGDEVQARIQSMANGATVGHLNVKDIRELALPKLPSIPTQQKISGILAAYDDLIENNTRRIKILEEMAQAIYREWFVEFRAPGVELRNATPEEQKLTGKDVFPKGWEVRPLQSLAASLTDGDWIETKDQGGEDYRLLQVSNIGKSEFVETGNYRYITQDTFDRLRCQEVLPRDILISRMPKPTGRAWLVTLQSWKMITAVDVAIMKVDERNADQYFVFYLLNSPEEIDQVERRTTGTTRPRISRSSLASIPVVVPPIALQKPFGIFAESSYQLCTKLRNKNTNLRRTRDLLLPKLISGEVEVEHIEVR